MTAKTKTTKSTPKTAKKKTSTKKKPTSLPAISVSEVTKLAPDDKNVVIRMYNIGFGDCFLLQIPTEEGVRRVLFDCGVHFSGHNPATTVDEIIDQVISDASDDGRARIDIVIATHRHQDHVSGFEDDRWNEVEVGEVWMPWTENYKDSKARGILKRQSTAGKKLQAALQLMIARPGRFGLGAAKVKELQAVADFALNSLTNPEAMATLHDGFKGGKNIRRQYLPLEKRPDNSFIPKLLPGVMVHVMGPSRDPEVIRDMEPPENEHWFAFMDQLEGDKPEIFAPFDVGWAIKNPNDEILQSYLDDFDKPTAQMTPAERAEAKDALNALKSVLQRVGAVYEGTEFSVAVSLDKAVNGTSLMMMFQIGNAYLLFPGDAQYGTWQSALKDDEWRELLTRTKFYKVGHHGSHNATPKEFVYDILQPQFRAMTPVYPVKSWKFIPKNELMTALQERPGDVIRSDQPFDGIADPTSFTRTRLYVETKIPIS